MAMTIAKTTATATTINSKWQQKKPQRLSAHKEELLKEIEHQLNLGPDGLDKQDRFLLECNFDDLADSLGENQDYWLLAIIAARKATRLRREVRIEAQNIPRKCQRRA